MKFYQRIYHFNTLICLTLVVIIICDQFLHMEIIYRTNHFSYISEEHSLITWLYKTILVLLLGTILVTKFIRSSSIIQSSKPLKSNLFQYYFFFIGFVVIIYDTVFLGRPYQAIFSLFYLFLFDLFLNPAKVLYSKNSILVVLRLVLMIFFFPVLEQSFLNRSGDAYRGEEGYASPIWGEYSNAFFPIIVPIVRGLWRIIAKVNWSYDASVKASYVYVSVYHLFSSMIFLLSLFSLVASIGLLTWEVKHSKKL